MRRATTIAVLFCCLSGLLGSAPAHATLTLADGQGIDVVSVTQNTSRDYDATIIPDALQREVHVRILLPTGYDANPTVDYPVLYLFHGTSGRASDWIQFGDATATTAGLDVIVVMPDAGINGNGGGWFTDWVNQLTPWGPSKWETFHVGELIPWVDANLRTVATREGRAVAGLSQGGFGATTYPARHPDMFVSAGSFSGAPDIDYNPLTATGATMVIGATEVGLNGTSVGVIFGSRITNEINWQGHDPAQLIENLRTVDLWLFTGSGFPGPPDFPFPNPAAMGIESLTHGSTMSFYERSLEVGYPVHLVHTGYGTHTWFYWAEDLRDYVGPMMSAFSSPSSVPASVAYQSVERDWSQWGWTVSMSRPANQEFTWLTDADASGFSLSGTGTATVTTPASYVAGSVHTVTMSGASGSVTTSATASGAGRLTISVPLGSVAPPPVMGVAPVPVPLNTTTVTIA